jgi:putative transposase
MLRFRQVKSLQKCASVHANVHNHFNLERHLVDRKTSKTRRSAALAEWRSLMARCQAGKGRTLPIGDKLRLD